MTNFIFFKVSIVSILVLFQIVIAGTTGKLVGTVKDKQTGEGLIGANVVLEGTTMGSSTDEDGYFSIINIPPGTYNITVHYIGYGPLQLDNVKVSVDRTTTQHFQLTPMAVSGEVVVVQATRPAIEIDRTHSSAVVSSETVESMPVTEVEDVIGLQAGVVRVGGELHFRGGRSREISYVVDGVPVNNSFSESGGSLVEVDNNMIEELEVISGTFNAEYGQALSGVVNIVTKRPASQFDFAVEAYMGDWWSNKTDTYLGIDDFDPLAERNLQFSATGPIIKNTLGFVVNARFWGFESVDRYQRRFNTADGWRIAAYREWANQQGLNEGTVIPIPDSLATGDNAEGPLGVSDYGSLQAKLRLMITPKVSLTYTAFGSFQETEGPLNVDKTTTGYLRSGSFFRYAPDDFGTIQQYSHSHFLRFEHFPSDKFFYNFSASYQRQDGDFFYRKDNKIAEYPGDEGIQLITATSANGSGNTFSLGGTSFLYNSAAGRGYIDQYLGQGDLNWQIDKYNFIKAGFSVNKIIADIYGRGFRITDDWRNRAYPLLTEISPADSTFDSYWAALVDYWENWDSNYGSRVEEVDRDEIALYRDFQVEPWEVAAYLQDKVELGGDLIINAGLRLDLFQPNSKVPINYRVESFLLGSDVNLQDASVKSQISPRLGISFPISSRGAFYASYGHFFQMPPYQRVYNEPLITLNRSQLQGRVLGNADLRPEKTIAYEIGLQQAVTNDIAVAMTAYYKDFRNLLGIEPVTTVDQVEYSRYINRDYGNSKGVTLDFTKRNGLVTGGINYTLSYANGSASDPDALIIIQSSTRLGGSTEVFPERKVLPLNWDQRHTLNGYVNIAKPNNWTIGLTGYVYSGTPYTPDYLERFDINRRELRNAAYKPTRWNVDLKMRKFFNFGSLQTALFLQVDNVFDNLNHIQVFSVSGQADEIAREPEIVKRDLDEINTEGLFTVDEVYTFPGNFSFPRRLRLGLELRF
jgi:outer membrane receptor protein involved in Fe transport